MNGRRDTCAHILRGALAILEADAVHADLRGDPCAAGALRAAAEKLAAYWDQAHEAMPDGA